MKYFDSVKLTFPGGHKCKIRINGFDIITDYPKELGGDGEYPKPWDIFLASVASCHGIHVLTWCLENGVPYDDIMIEVDVIEDPNQEGKFTDFIIMDNLPESFPREKMQAMLDESTEDCWVNRHISEYDVRVRYELKHAEGETLTEVKGA